MYDDTLQLFGLNMNNLLNRCSTNTEHPGLPRCSSGGNGSWHYVKLLCRQWRQSLPRDSCRPWMKGLNWRRIFLWYISHKLHNAYNMVMGLYELASYNKYTENSFHWFEFFTLAISRSCITRCRNKAQGGGGRSQSSDLTINLRKTHKRHPKARP